LVIGVSREEAWPIVVKVGLDCMPKLRRSVFIYLARHDGWNTTTSVAGRVGNPTQTARRSLEDLMGHGLVRLIMCQRASCVPGASTTCTPS
jgi:hypothetical protein